MRVVKQRKVPVRKGRSVGSGKEGRWIKKEKGNGI